MGIKPQVDDLQNKLMAMVRSDNRMFRHKTAHEVGELVAVILKKVSHEMSLVGRDTVMGLMCRDLEENGMADASRRIKQIKESMHFSESMGA